MSTGPAFPSFALPIVQAPLAGGPSTPELTAAVTRAGGFGFLAAGYKTPESVRAEIDKLRALSVSTFGLNLFLPSAQASDPAALASYIGSLGADAERYGVQLGAAVHDDDALDAKLAVAIQARVPVISFTFGCPSAELIQRLHAHAIGVWVTVTDLSELALAVAAGADALVLQGIEAGGHRGSFQDLDGTGELGLLSFTRLAARACSLPLLAAGGLMDGPGIAAVLVAGARAAQLGTAYMRCPEAGTSAAQRALLADPSRHAPTQLTRAFTGRRARGIQNAFMRRHGADAPSAYPELNHVTAPLRAAARAALQTDDFNLWAGQAYALAQERPAFELTQALASEARQALEVARNALR
jgi:nitronate monooxygenase